MRFTADGTLAVVYESASPGNAFLSAPRCGGDAITLTSYGEQGDEQVTATLLRPSRWHSDRQLAATVHRLTTLTG